MVSVSASRSLASLTLIGHVAHIAYKRPMGIGVRSVGQSVCSSVGNDREFSKTADSIKLPFWMVSVMGPRNRVLGGRGHWRHQASTVERLCAAATSGLAMRGGYAACCRTINQSKFIF